MTDNPIKITQNQNGSIGDGGEKDKRNLRVTLALVFSSNKFGVLILKGVGGSKLLSVGLA